MNDTLTEQVRRATYDSFALEGRCPSRAQIAGLLSVADAQVDEAMASLVAQRHVVTDASGEAVMAHPFTARNLGFSVMGQATLWWGGCAWDSFALPHVILREPRVLVATGCPHCDRALAWHVSRNARPDGSVVAHFLVPMRDCWSDVVHACSHQRIFCSSDCVEAWLAETGHERGYEMDLQTLWRLARDWLQRPPR